MTLRTALLALALIFPAAATEAADAGDNAVVIGVTKVTLPDNLPGLCQVGGVIGDVLDGKAFHQGQQISLQVPCGSYANPRPLLPAVQAHGPQLLDPNLLQGVRLGSAHLDDAGHLLWAPTQPYGHWGAVSGFRVLEAAPLNQSRAS
jgi:hypothetical protein